MRTSRNPSGFGCRQAISLIVCSAIAAMQANAAILSWNNASGGSAATSGNWNPTQVPAAADDLLFNLNNTYAVTFNSTVGTSRTHLYRRGTVTLTMSSPHTATTGVTIGDTNALTGTATLTTGSFTSQASVVLGTIAGSAGVLNVNDDDADFLITGAGADLTVGSNGNGTLSITGGGRVRVADQFIAAGNGTSTVNVTISGFSVAPIAVSELDVLGTSQSRIGQVGDATMNITNGGVASFAGDLVIANGSASVSTITVEDAGLLPSRLNVAGDLMVARNSTASSAAGDGTLTINDGGAVDVGDQLLIGDPDGGSGHVEIFDGGTLIAKDIIVHPVTGVMQMRGGTTTVDGGIFDPKLNSLTIDSTIGSPQLHLVNGADTSLSGATVALRIGNAGMGLLTVDGVGSEVEVTGGDTVLGVSNGSNGTFTISNGAQAILTNLGTLFVGQSGIGSVHVQTSSLLSSGDCLLGTANSGRGQVVVNAPGATWNVTGELFVGGDATNEGGIGDVVIGNGGVVNVTAPGMNVFVWPNGGTLRVLPNGTLNSNGIIEVDGLLDMNAGTINANQLNLDANNSINGLINADFSFRTPGTTLTLSGDLTAGRSNSPNGFSSSGSINVGSRTLTIHDSNNALLGNCDLTTSGRVIAVNGIQNSFGKTISGYGTIEANILNQGSISSGATGLKFAGIINGIGQGITGTTIHFLAGGGFTGTGTLASTVSIDGLAGSVITATGPLTLGNNASTNGFATAGALHCGTHEVTLRDLDIAHIGNLTTIAGGTLRFDNGASPPVAKTVRLDSGTLSGHGTVFARLDAGADSVITATGNLNIGDSKVDSVGIRGTLHVGSHFVSLLSSDDVPLGSLTTIAGGTLTGPNDPGLFQVANFVLSNGDVLQGFGHVDTHLAGAAGSTINATGTLTIRGTAESFLGGSFNGTLNVLGHAVSYLAPPNLDGTVHLAGGSLGCPGGVRIGGELHGPGAIVGNLVHSSQVSTLNPGAIHPDGTLSVEGNLLADSPNSSATIHVRVNGAGPSQFDSIFVNGSATLGDTLAIEAPSNFNAPVGSRLTIIAAQGGRTGEFEHVSGAKIDDHRAFLVRYAAKSVVLQVLAFHGSFFACDANCDGSINQFDINPFVNVLSAGGGCAANIGDTDANGTVNAFDINGFVDCLTAP